MLGDRRVEKKRFGPRFGKPLADTVALAQRSHDDQDDPKDKKRRKDRVGKQPQVDVGVGVDKIDAEKKTLREENQKGQANPGVSDGIVKEQGKLWAGTFCLRRRFLVDS